MVLTSQGHARPYEASHLVDVVRLHTLRPAPVGVVKLASLKYNEKISKWHLEGEGVQQLVITPTLIDAH